MNWVHDLIVIVASLLAVVITYFALYLASLVTLKPIIGHWGNATTVAFRPIVNSTMLVIYLTSPFNAYEALMLHAGIVRYFALSVCLPTVILALVLMLVPVLCQVGIVDCEAVGRWFLIRSFALALATSYITSLIIWLTLGKPSIGTSIYMEFTLASAIYVTLYSTAALLKRLRSLRYPLMRFVTLIVLSLLVVIIVGIAYLTLNLLPPTPTPPHIIGLVLTVTILAGYLTRHIGQARLVFWIVSVLFVIGLDIYLYIYYPKEVGPEIFTGVLIAVVTIAPFLYRRIVAVPILMIEVPREDVIRRPILATLDLPQTCKCPVQQQSQQQSQQMFFLCICQCPTSQQPAIICNCPHKLIIQQPQQQAQQPPQQQVQQQQQAPQEVGYLRLRVRNLGLAAARDCVFQVKITRWPSNCPINCHAPSDEYVDWQDITWADGLPRIMIRPNDVRYANIAIMPLDANKQACFHIIQWNPENQCGSRCGPIIAWIAKRDVFDPRSGCTARLQDGLVPGEYRIDTQVTCRNGQKTLKGLRLRVDQSWNNTDITTA